MKQLEKQFTMNADKLGEMEFTQVKRTDRVALYKRSYLDGRFHSYEVFLISTIKEGAALPNGLKVEETYERYCTSNSRNCIFTRDLDRAESYFDELVKKAEGLANTEEPTVAGEPKRRGRKAQKRPEIVLPNSKSWKMKDLLLVNSGWTQPVLYIALQKMIKSKSVKVMGEEKSESGRGKPSKVYASV